MTTTLPRPIEPGEIKAGQRFRLTWDDDEMNCTITATAANDWDARLGGVRVSSSQYVWGEPNGTWELIAEAPAPAPAVGSRWRGTVGAEYIYTDTGEYRCYSGPSFDLTPGRDPNAIAALTPIPDHGDGCSEWLWDPETDAGWVACKVGGSGATHRQVRGSIEAGGYLSTRIADRAIARRFRPWSERGQANG